MPTHSRLSLYDEHSSRCHSNNLLIEFASPRHFLTLFAMILLKRFSITLYNSIAVLSLLFNRPPFYHTDYDYDSSSSVLHLSRWCLLPDDGANKTRIVICKIKPPLNRRQSIWAVYFNFIWLIWLLLNAFPSKSSSFQWPNHHFR